MLHFGVWENTPRALPLLRGIPHVLWTDARRAPGALDALLVMPPAAGGRRAHAGPPEGSRFPAAATTLLPGELAGRAGPLAAQTVTYGLSPLDTLTLSSVEDGSLFVALQRELVTLAGARVERQEWKIPEIWGREATVALCGALLLCGVPPPEIGVYWESGRHKKSPSSVRLGKQTFS